jgi:sugar phosphate isomerase/epimerase
VTELTLWMGTVGQGSFRERLAAAATCGYSSMSVAPTDCDALPATRVRSLADAAGIRLIALDPLVSWLPGSEPPDGWRPDPARRALIDRLARFEVDHVLDLAAILGCATVTVIEPYGTSVPVEHGAAAFAEVCDHAARSGLAVQLEAMPFSGIPDLISARSIVDMAGRSNGGLVLDTWHLFRSGGDPSIVATLPIEGLSVQLCDGPAVAEADLWAEALNRRLLPGDGSFDLAGVMAALRLRGFDGPIGPEVISAELRACHPVDAACRAARACRTLLRTSFASRTDWK